VDPGGSGVTVTASVLSTFGDGLNFIVEPRTGRGGGEVGGPSANGELVWEHLKLCLVAMLAACAVALPIGLWLGHTRRAAFLAVSIANIGRAVPAIALLFLFFAFLGAGFANVALALTLLAIPPILTNAYVGVREVDPDAVDAARGMGMTGMQILRRVELPLALGLVFGGIRTSAVNVVATATIAPLAGVVTLGDPIINPSIYGEEGRLGAAILVALLAVLTEVLLAAVQRAVSPKGLSTRAPRGRLIASPRRRVTTTP
jgi:osmoprotectant transport system permease protein